MTKRDDQFTPATGKFATYADGEPVMGWVTASSAIERNEMVAAIQRAVVISDEDRTLLMELRLALDSDSHKEHIALLDRLIGKR